MRVMEAVDVSNAVDEVLRYLAKNREPILVLKDGLPHCRMLPPNRVELEMLRVLRRREARKERAIRRRQ